jgi:hypothetical protein
MSQEKYIGMDVHPANHQWLAALCNSMASPPAAGKLMSMKKAKLLQRSKSKVGWISRNSLGSGRGGSFFLDIPFYRTR